MADQEPREPEYTPPHILPDEDPDNPDDPTLSFKDRLLAQRKVASRATLLELPVPGYDDLLVVRYGKSLSWVQATKAIEKAQRSKDQMAQLWAMCDVLVATVEGIYGRDKDEDELVLISNHFDQKLSDLLELGVSSAREVIRLVYGSDLVVGATQARVMTWIQQVEQDSGTEIAGN